MDRSPPAERGTPLWAWALGCAGVVALGAVVTGGVGVYAWLTMHSEVYEQAEQAVARSPEVAARVGDGPEVTNWYPRGQTQLTQGGGTAIYTFAVRGSKGTEDVQVLSIKETTGWAVQDLQVPDGAGWVSLLPPTTAPSISLSQASSPTGAAPVPADPALARSLTDAGHSLYDEGQYAAAVAKLDAAIEADPRFSDAWHWRGRSRAQLHDDLGAGADLTQAVELDPANAGAWESLAWVHAHAGQDDRALDDLNHLLALRPGDPKALNDRANAWFRTGNMAAAETDANASCAAGLSLGCTTLDRIRAGR